MVQVLGALVIIACAAGVRDLEAQAGGSPYPLIDQPAAVAKGDTVRVLNIVRVMAHGSAGSSMQVQYGSRIPASDSAGRRSEAALVVKYFSANADASGTKEIIAAVCDTRACAEMREDPAKQFRYVFERAPNGEWVAANQAAR